ncbi:MAG: sugar phosphate isomerase/epimerase [Chloroflexi bacterium]|nr:sugar phosphate isomerase/epimerase [Chloroflexota bacterium]
MQLGYSTWGMPTVPIDVSLKHIADLGFDAIEITVLPNFTTAVGKLDSSERTRIVHLLQEHKLALSAVGSYLNFMEQDPDQFAQNFAYVQSAIDLAVDWTRDGQQPVVISGFGGQPGDLATQQDQLVERLNAIGEYAQARGVTLAFEHHVGAAVETPDQTVGLMQQVASPAVRLNFDISHFNVVGVPIEESVAKMMPYTAHTHVKDERGRSPHHEYLIPGEGEFDYVRYLKAMQAHDYTGFVSTEISMMVQRRPNYDPLATATQSYKVLSKAFADAGIERKRGK